MVPIRPPGPSLPEVVIVSVLVAPAEVGVREAGLKTALAPVGSSGAEGLAQFQGSSGSPRSAARTSYAYL